MTATIGFPSAPFTDGNGNLTAAARFFLQGLYEKLGGAVGVGTDAAAVSAALTAEIAARTASDAALTAEITAEATNRENGDIVEAKLRTAADATGAAATAAVGTSLSTVASAAATTTFVTTAVGAETTRATAAEALLAPKASPALTGTPTAPTAAPGTNTTQIATTAFVTAAAGAPLNSPAFTGTPTAPTAAPGTNTTQLATTAFVAAADALLAPLASPAFTGTPAAPTAAAGTNTTQLATTAYVVARVSTRKLLYETSTSVGNGADTTEDILQTFVVTASQLATVGDRLILEAGGTLGATTDSRAVRVRLNTTTLINSFATLVAAQIVWAFRIVIMKTGSNTQSIIGMTNSTSIGAAVNSTQTITDTSAITITVTGQNATNPTANSIVCRYFTVDYVAAA